MPFSLRHSSSVICHTYGINNHMINLQILTFGVNNLIYDVAVLTINVREGIVTTDKKLIAEVHKMLDADRPSMTVLRRRARWEGLLIELHAVGGEVIALGSMGNMWDHVRRLIHVWVLWGHYRAVYLCDEQEHASISEMLSRSKAMSGRLSEKVLRQFVADGKTAGIWSTINDQGDQRSKRVVPSDLMLRDDLTAHIAAFSTLYLRKNNHEQRQDREMWKDDLFFPLEKLELFAEIVKTRASRRDLHL